jgi:hypothetical protein
MISSVQWGSRKMKLKKTENLGLNYAIFSHFLSNQTEDVVIKS